MYNVFRSKLIKKLAKSQKKTQDQIVQKQFEKRKRGSKRRNSKSFSYDLVILCNQLRPLHKPWSCTTTASQRNHSSHLHRYNPTQKVFILRYGIWNFFSFSTGPRFIPLSHCRYLWLQTEQRWGRTRMNQLVAQQTPLTHCTRFSCIIYSIHDKHNSKVVLNI